MARSKRSKRELRNRRVRKEITEGIRKKQLEDICKNLEETTGVIAGSTVTPVKEEEAVTMGAGEEEVAGVITIDENTPVDASMFKPTVIGGGDDDVQMTTSSSTSTKSKKSTKAGSKMKKNKRTGGSKFISKKKKSYKKKRN